MNVQVRVDQRRQPGRVDPRSGFTQTTQLGDNGVGVTGIPQNNRVKDQSQRSQLVLLTLPVGLAKLSPLAVEQLAGQSVP